MKKRLFLVLSTCLLIPALCAQKLEVGGGLGGLLYKGDISPALHPGFVRPGGHLFFRYNKSQALSIRASVLAGSIGANDAQVQNPFNRARGFSFRTRLTEISTDLEYNFLNYRHDNLRRAGNWTPYVFGGVALFGFRPNQEASANYRKNGLALPFGVGAKWQLGSPWSLGVELGTRKTFTDYLDNLGQTTDPNNKLAQGDPSHQDLYYYVSVSLSYTFYRIVCP